VSVCWWWLLIQAGVDADNILAAAHTLSRADKVDLQERTLLLLTNQMDRFLASRTDAGARRCHCKANSLLSAATCSQLLHRRSFQTYDAAYCYTCPLWSVGLSVSLSVCVCVLITDYFV